MKYFIYGPLYSYVDVVLQYSVAEVSLEISKETLEYPTKLAYFPQLYRYKINAVY